MSNLYAFRAEVLALYDTCRTARLNRDYYGHKLSKARSVHRVCDAIVAIGSSAAVGGWTIWDYAVGQPIWAAVGVTVTLIALLKPVLSPVTEIERYARLFTAYGGLYHTVNQRIEVAKQDSEPDPVALQDALEWLKKLSEEDDPKPNRRLIAKLQDEIDQAMPADTLWMPEVR